MDCSPLLEQTDEHLPKLVLMNAFTRTVDIVTRSEMAMAKTDLSVINSYRTLQIHVLLNNKMYEDSNKCLDSNKDSRTAQSPPASSHSEHLGSVASSSSAGGQPETAERRRGVFPAVGSLPETSGPLQFPVSVRASDTITSRVTTTSTSTRCHISGEVTSGNSLIKKKNTAVTYCYSTPNTVRLKPNKIPYKVVGKRYLDEQKFIRFLSKKIKNLDFPMAFAEILNHVKRVDDMGVGVCRDRLLKLLKAMIESKRRK